MWQALRSELHPRGLEIVTVALDVGGADAARPWIERAHPEHPSLVDQAHLLDELLGVVNVPSGTWIDETGTIVRPPETAYPARPAFLDRPAPPGAPPHVVERVRELRRLRIEPERYVAALRDWVEHGARSRFALTPEEVMRRSGQRGSDEARAAAEFELGQYLYRRGRGMDAIPHFREAHHLQPNNWTYKRQAWSLVDPSQGPTPYYEGDWLADVRKIGAEQYYPPLDL